MIGTRLGAYEITGKLGEGGMGEVYRATDSGLKREVAIKVLPAAFTADRERLARFEREAQLLAQLHHPHVASIFGLERADSVLALVMELVEGEDLSALLARGPLPSEEALAIARQIAEALEAAHERGIVHRDLKPANVKVAANGTVKVLDFGLAKAIEAGGPAAGSPQTSPTLLNSPTLTAAQGTQLGMILGTAAYMAPEQARGKAVDKRADVWAFGVVLYEMLSGRRLFAGEEISDVLAAVLRQEIDLGALPPATPPALRTLLRRCLDRDPRNRLHDIADARIALDEVIAGRGDDGWVAAAGTAPRRRAAIATAVALAGGLGLVAGWLGSHRLAAAPAVRPVHVSVAVPDELVVDSMALVAPDGGALFFLARRRDDPSRERSIYRRDLAADEAVRLDGTERAVTFLRTPFVLTPDGRSVLFRQGRAANLEAARLMRVPADGSGPALELSPWDQAWSSDLTLVEGEPVVLLGRTRMVHVGSVGEVPPVVLDIGREGQFFFSPSPPLPGGRGVPIGFEQVSGRIWRRGSALVDPRSGRGTLILEDGFWPRFVPPDRLLFSRGTTLLGARIDLATGRLQGAPVALLDGLRVKEEWEGAVFALADDGTLVYAAGGAVGAQRTFAILDPASGTVEPWGDEARQFDAMVKPATAGGSVYTSLADASGRLEVWRVPRTGPMQPVVALADGDAGYPALSPDGRQVAFVRFTGMLGSSILVAPVDGSAAPREVLRTDFFEWPGVWAPDGRRLLVEHYEAGQRSLRELTLDSGEAPRTLAAKAGQGAISPDGRWLAFSSYESGRQEVYLAAYPSAGALGERRAVTRYGGSAPSWSGDGRTIYFSDLEGHILAAAVSAGGAPEEPRIVGDAEALRAGQFSVLPDGRLLFVQRGPRESEIRRFDVILHFDRMLAERVP